MKKLSLKASALLLGMAFILSSCVGSFGLHQRLVNWNMSLGNKLVNELVYLGCNIVPVYEVCYLADALVINSIEFWTGDNPIAAVGTIQNVKGENGNYMVETTANGYSITKEGEQARLDLVYNQTDDTWNAVSEGVSTPIVRIEEDGTATMLVQR